MSYGFSGAIRPMQIVFKLQKRVIRIMMGCGYRETCRDLFKEFNILPLKSQYIFSLMMFVVKTEIVLLLTRNVIKLILDKLLTCTCLR
jgi:hypothetical protein